MIWRIVADMAIIACLVAVLAWMNWRGAGK